MIRRLLILALALAHVPTPAPSRTSCKPTAPIDLEAALEGDPVGTFGVTARASSRLDAPVDLEIILPHGVTLQGGRPRASGRACDAHVDASARDRSRREIFVRATVVQGSARLTKVVPLVLFDAPPAAPAPRRKTNSRGEAIAEFSP